MNPSDPKDFKPAQPVHDPANPMAEKRMSESGFPDPQPSLSPPDPSQGSELAGFFIAWAVLIASWVFLGTGGFILLNMFGNRPGSGIQAITGLIISYILPIASPIALMFWFRWKGKTRSARGVFLAIGSMIALFVLLVAACFGILSLVKSG